jgi:hypothetical protein
MQAHGNTTIATSYGGQELNSDEGKWFLVWMAVWMVALAALLPALI